MIAILGATGYVGRSLAKVWVAEGVDHLLLFARDRSVLTRDNWPRHVSVRDLADFNAAECALVINAIGAGDPTRVKTMGTTILDITHAWDQRVLATMDARTRYVFLSSGAVYGGAFDQAVDANWELRLPVNDLKIAGPYVVAKLNAEARHRHAADRSILDLRIFGFADRGIPLSGSSFLADLARAVATRQPLITSRDDLVRDYAGARELAAFIRCWQNSGAPNRALDLYTLAPVAKQELLEAAATRYGLTICRADRVGGSPTGLKAFYASSFRAGADLGYRPDRNSRQVVMDALDAIRAG